MRHAAIVGGGIGGLCAAIGLRRAGWQVTVFERAPEFREIGAGIQLWPNALRALRALGLGERIAPLLTPQPVGQLRDHRGRWLTRFDRARFERELGYPLLVSIHRADLLGLLREALPSEALRPGSEVTETTPDGVIRWGTNESTVDLVVAADGIHSGVRRRLWPDHPGPKYSGYTAFRAVLDKPGRLELAGMVGPGAQFGLVPMAGDRLHWFAAIDAPRGTRHEDPRAFLSRRFRGWPAPVSEVLERTPAEHVLQHDLFSLRAPLPSYVNGRVALLGDAAHAMTLFLGQGGAQAIEDAVVLAAAVSTHEDISDALAYYDRERRPRSQLIARRSDQMGRVSQLSNPIAIALRNAVIRVLPPKASLRSTMALTDWSPPEVRSQL